MGGTFKVLQSSQGDNIMFLKGKRTDIPEEKKSIFNALKEPLQKILVDD